MISYLTQFIGAKEHNKALLFFHFALFHVCFGQSVSLLLSDRGLSKQLVVNPLTHPIDDLLSPDNNEDLCGICNIIVTDNDRAILGEKCEIFGTHLI